VALQKAKDANMPNENVERNIKKASSSDQAAYTEVTYELYGHGGVGILVEIMTDNKNRISIDMQVATNKRGGKIAMPGAVAFNFDHKGVIQVAKKNAEEDTLFMTVSEAGAEDFEAADELFIITTPPDKLIQVKESIVKLNIPVESAELQMLPKTMVTCSPEDTKANLDLIEWIENLDDVDAVYHNMTLSEGT
jgi:YebC/PmpR family DNA-binding regulatory protein